MSTAVQRAGNPVRVSDEQFYLVLLAVLTAIAWGFVTSLALLLHRNFLTIACDTAVLQNGIVNTLHGHWFATNGAGGPNILASHTTFMLLLVIPFYLTAPHPETLFILQTAGVYSTVFPLFLVARELGQKPLVAFFVAGSTLASAFLVHMAMAPFHLETWIAAATLWSYYFYLRNNLAGFLVSLFAAVCCGEQAALIYIALGLSLALVDDGCAWRGRFGRISFIAGLLWLVLAVGVISPLATGVHPFNIFAYNYTAWGVSSAAGLPQAIAHHPGRAFDLLFSPYRWGHIGSIMGLLLPAAFFSRRSLILLLVPMPAYLLMSDQEFYLYFHAYYYTFVFVAGYLGLLLFLRRPDTDEQTTVAVLAAYLLVSLLALCGATGYYFQLKGGTDDFSQTLRAAFAKIPVNATVYGPHRYSVYLSNRENLVIGDLREKNLDFDAMLNVEFDKTNVRPKQVDYIVSDFLTDQCGWRLGFQNSEQHQARSDAIDRLVASGKWERFWEEHDVVILKRVR